MNEYRIDVVDKALDVLMTFDFQHRELSIDEVAERVGVARSRAYRILQTLLARGFLVLNTGRAKYSLGPGVARLGLVARRGDEFADRLLDSMREIHAQFQETVNLGVFDGEQLVYAEILESPYPFRISERVGDPVPLATTALGRAVLSALQHPEDVLSESQWRQVRAHVLSAQTLGYSLDDEDTVQGARCIGVPLLDPGGAVFGAISVSGPVSRVTEAAVPLISAALNEAAQRIVATKGRGTRGA